MKLLEAIISPFLGCWNHAHLPHNPQKQISRGSWKLGACHPCWCFWEARRTRQYGELQPAPSPTLPWMVINHALFIHGKTLSLQGDDAVLCGIIWDLSLSMTFLSAVETNQELIMSQGGITLLAMAATNAEDPQTLRMVAGAIANLCGNGTISCLYPVNISFFIRSRWTLTLMEIGENKNHDILYLVSLLLNHSQCLPSSAVNMMMKIALNRAYLFVYLPE